MEDRRGMRTAGIAGGISLTGILMVLAVGYFGGTDQALNLLSEMQNSNTEQQTTVVDHQYDGNDAYEMYAKRVLGSTNAVWNQKFSEIGRTYYPSKLILFREATPSACGGADSQVGPHYCSVDKSIYLDETFFDELTSRFGAHGGDIAQ